MPTIGARPCRHLGIVLSLPWVVAGLFTPEARAAPLVERTTSELVLIEVFATDARGRPVPDLTSDDFILHVDGRASQMPIASFEFVEGPRPPRGGPETSSDSAAGLQTAGREAEGAAAGADRPGQAAPPRRFVLFFEDSASEPTGMTAARLAAEAFLRRRGAPDDLIALVSYESTRLLRVLHDFTTDREALITALRASIGDNNRHSTLESVSRRGKMSEKRMAGMGRDLAREDAFRMSRALKALTTLIDGLGAWPGYKALVFMGEGFPENPGQDYGLEEARFSLGPELAALPLSAAAAGVTIHTVQTAGIVTIGQGLSLPAASRRNATLASLAINTGGLKVVSNDMLGALSEVEGSSRSYYVLGFVPEGTPDGRFHSVNLKTRRRDLSLRYRHGFTRFTPEEARTRALEAAFLAPELQSGLVLDLAVVPGPAVAEERVVDLVIYVPPGKILFLPRPDGSTGQLDVGLVALDGTGRETLRFARQISVRLRTDDGSPEAPPLDIVTRVQLPLVGQTLTAVVSDRQSGSIGAARARIDATPREGSGVHGLSLYSQDERSLWIPVEAGTQAQESPSQVPSSMGPALKTRFARGERVACGFKMPASRSPDAPALQLAIEHNGKVLKLAPVGALPASTSARSAGDASMGASLSLEGLLAGDYALAVRELQPAGPADLGRLAFTVGP